MKKFASLILALALSLALCIPAFAAESVPTITLRDGEVGDKWVVGDFVIEIIDAEAFQPVTRAGYIYQNEEYTSAASGSFRWSCGANPLLKLSVDCIASKTAVNYTFKAGTIASIEDTVNATDAKFWSITSTNPNNQYATVNFTFKPVSTYNSMNVSFSAWEGQVGS